MTIYEAALAILTRPGVLAQIHQWLGENPLPEHQDAPDAAAWWQRYCFSVITSQQRITDGFWAGVHEDEEWSAVAYAGANDPRPTVEALQEILLRHGVRRHLDKGRWIHRAWEDLDVDVIAQAGEDATTEGTTSRASELQVVASLLRECRGLGVGPKVARLMMIWNPELGTMGVSFRHVIPLDRRWINALREEGVDIEPNLSNEASYRAVEDEICSAAVDAGLLPFLADGAVFGWMNQ